MSARNAFYDAKIDKCFGHLDADGSGELRQSDLDRIAERLLVEFGRATPEQMIRTRQAARDFWAALVAFADADADTAISRAEYLAAFDAHVRENDEGFLTIMGPALAAFADLMDIDGSGTVAYEEFAALHRAYRVDEAQTRASFAVLDVDADSSLTTLELLDAARDFYTSVDPDARGNIMWGPLE